MKLRKLTILWILTLAFASLALAQTEALRITKGPEVEQIGTETAVIKWSTSEQSNAMIHYGVDPNKLDMTSQAQWGGPDHQVTVKNLKPNTTYHFQVMSAQGKGSGTGALARVMSFQTKAGDAVATTGTTTAQSANSANNVQITDGPRIEFVGDNSALIAWTTSSPSSAVVRFGTDRNQLDQVAQQQWGGQENAGGRRTHRVEVKNLKPNTAYFFLVESAQGQGTGTMAKSEITALQTLTPEAAAQNFKNKQGATLKFQAGPVPQSVTDKTAALWLMTSEDVAVTVKYGTDRSNLSQNVQSPTSKLHLLQLTNLQPSTTYFFEVSAADGAVKETGQFQTENAQFATQRPRVYLTKGPVIEYITRDYAMVAWSTNVRSSSMVRYGTDINNLNQTAQAPWGQETHRVNVRNLKPNVKYYFVVESAQAEGSGTLAKSNPAPFVTVAPGQQAMRNQQPR